MKIFGICLSIARKKRNARVLISCNDHREGCLPILHENNKQIQFAALRLLADSEHIDCQSIELY